MPTFVNLVVLTGEPKQLELQDLEGTFYTLDWPAMK